MKLGQAQLGFHNYPAPQNHGYNLRTNNVAMKIGEACGINPDNEHKFMAIKKINFYNKETNKDNGLRFA